MGCFQHDPGLGERKYAATSQSRSLNGVVTTPLSATAFVQNLLKEVQSKYQGMSDQIGQNVDDIGSRIGELERSLNTLISEATIEDVARAEQ